MGEIMKSNRILLKILGFIILMRDILGAVPDIDLKSEL